MAPEARFSGRLSRHQELCGEKVTTALFLPVTVLVGRHACYFSGGYDWESVLKKYVLSAALMLLSTPVLAADLSSPAETDAPQAKPLPRWTGFYLGFTRGFGGGVLDSGMGLLSATPGVTVGGTATNRASGFTAGGVAGYNYQLSNYFVLGAETDLQWSDIRASSQFSRWANYPGFLANSDSGAGLNWYGTVRGRVGYSIGRVMPYVTGGLVYGQLEAKGTPFPGANSLSLGSATETRTGWTMGAGADIAITKNLSARSEYLFLSLPSVGGSAVGALQPGGVPLAGSFGAYPYGVHTVRGGLNYRFAGVTDDETTEQLAPLLNGDLNGFLTALPARDWSGFYIGANAGYGGDVLREYSSLVSSATAPQSVGLSTYGANRTGGFVGGAQVGYNHHLTKHFVLGAETDAQWSGVTAQNESNVLESGYGGVSNNDRTTLEWFGTSRARLGFAQREMLAYITGGVAYGQINHWAMQGQGGGLFGNGASYMRAGWAAGAGADYAMTSDLSLRAEYLYVSLAGISGVSTGVVAPNVPLIGQFSTGSVSSNIMRVGVNWKFRQAEEPSATSEK
jgi:outer membrane immunogenic protein